MPVLEGVVYFVVNEDEIIYATYDVEEAEKYANNQTYSDIEDTAEEFDMDIEHLDDDEFAEIAFMSGFEGGYYYIDHVELPDEEELEDFTFETRKGDYFTYEDLIENFDFENNMDIEFGNDME